MDKALRSLVDWYAKVGVDVPELAPIAAPVKKRAALNPPKPTGTVKPTRQKATGERPLPNAGIAAKAAKTLDELRVAVQNFDAGSLSDGARQAVFSRGNPEADLMIIGEAPGRDEDIQGKPFVGRSGQLLDHMLAAIGLTEDSYYITNIVNWRPPKNRNPKPEEIEMCRPFLERHIELTQPKILLLVGGVSMTALTGETGIMKNHGQWQDIEIGGISLPALPLYHPAFLLRQPALKKDAWRDLLSLRAKLEAL